MRMYLTIRFNKPIPTDIAYPSPGGFEVETGDGRTYRFDFCESEAGIVDGKPDTVSYTLRDEDAAAFPEVEELKHRLQLQGPLNRCGGVAESPRETAFAATSRPLSVRLTTADG